MTADPLRVLLIAHGFPPESVGGVEQHVDGLARALAGAGHAVHVLAKTGRAGYEQGTLIDESTATLRVTRVVYRYEGLDTFESLYRSAVIDSAVDRFVGEHGRFDVAHVHHLTGLSVGIFDVLASHRVPAVLTLHDYWLMCARGQMWHPDGTACAAVEPVRCTDCLRSTFPGWVGEDTAVVTGAHELALATLRQPARLIVPSARATPPFERLGVDGSRITVVENAVDVAALRDVPLSRADPTRPLRVGYLGALIPSKGLDVLVAAAQRLPAGVVEVHAFGNAVPYHGDTGFLTRVLGSLRPHDRVVCHGPYATSQLPEIFGRIDVLAAPALWAEAFGLTVREAIAAGRPPVVSRIGGLQDAVRDGVDGRLVEPGDPEALARVLAEWAADRSLVARLAEACRSGGRVRDFAAMAAELAALYRELRHGRNAPNRA